MSDERVESQSEEQILKCCIQLMHDMEIEREGFSKGLNKAYQEICILEEECLDHTENEDGEWVTMTIDYGKWADILMKLEQAKSNI